MENQLLITILCAWPAIVFPFLLLWQGRFSDNSGPLAPAAPSSGCRHRRPTVQTLAADGAGGLA